MYVCAPQPGSSCNQDGHILLNEHGGECHKNPPQMLLFESFQVVWCHLHPISTDGNSVAVGIFNQFLST